MDTSTMRSPYTHKPGEIAAQKAAREAVKAGHDSTSPSVAVLRERVKALEEAIAMVKPA